MQMRWKKNLIAEVERHSRERERTLGSRTVLKRRRRERRSKEILFKICLARDASEMDALPCPARPTALTAWALTHLTCPIISTEMTALHRIASLSRSWPSTITHGPL